MESSSGGAPEGAGQVNMEFKLLSSRENKLLGRMEMEYLFRDASGRLSRADLVKFVAGQLSASPDGIIPYRIRPVTGTRDLRALVYVYRDPAEAKRQLPEYAFLRLASKEERAKALEEKRKAKAAQRSKAKGK
ncbi:hypothetical protein [Conexivisphaera calida]|uniref:30S ribosomal protein S24e n=1 Tax=Conexivisphaera calida TaxID=1874277 RepID=A0A4P2VD66_9ARCH|nr:hypothetical protein [Conexivisphaera calida]BBE41762.1 hypothetical protein NAS2_0371 [Conexivisphaera calida]